MLRPPLIPTLAACLPLLLSSALAAPGDLDFTFGIGGRVTTEGASFLRFGCGVAVQSDGKMVVAGGRGEFVDIENIDVDWAVMRYEADGALDSGFGTGGRVVTDFGGVSVPLSVAVQGDGKVLVAGYAIPTGTSSVIALARYLSDGSLDTSFGSGGKVTTDVGSSGASGHAVGVQGDGKILVAGSASNGSNGDFALVRYQADGSLDPAFGTGGKVLTDFGGTLDSGRSVALQSDGKIVVAGQTTDGSNLDFGVARHHANGSLDLSFGGTGKARTDFNGARDDAASVAVQADGKIVVGGTTGISASGFAMARYNSDGNLDAGFGGAGKVTTTIVGALVGRSVAVQGDGKILIAGQSDAAGRSGVGLARYHPDGTQDAGFGGGRVVSTFFGRGDSIRAQADSMALQSDGRIVVAGFFTIRRGPAARATERDFEHSFVLARYYAGEPALAPAPPVFDTETTSAAGTAFRDFRSPAIDGGQVGGLATVAGDTGRSEVAAYAGADGAVLVANGGLDPEGGTFIELGDPTFGGKAVGFAGTASLAPVSALRDWQMDARLGSERMLSARPGGRVAALYSQLSAIAGLRRLAVQTGPAPGTDGQFARFTAFGLPRDRGGLIFAARLHRSGTVTRRNDFGVWRETPAGGLSELLLRIGRRLGGSLAPAESQRTRGADDPRTVEKLSLLGPVTNATDQRRSFAPDGGVAAVADFDDDSEGVVFVAADGSIDVPVDSNTPVPDEDGAPVDGIEFTAFSQPATASGGRFALAAALRAAQRGTPPPPSHAVFANRDGTLRRVFSRNDRVPGREGVNFAQLGQPLLGERGMIGLLTALRGQQVQPASRKAIVLLDDKVKAVAARLGEHASGYDERVSYRRFISVVVTDSDPARLVFTGTVSGPGVTARDNLGLWSVSPSAGVNLLMRTGQEIDIGGTTLTLRTFDALKAPPKSMGQGRSTDADGFVTAKATLSDGRKGVLRIPLP